MATDQAQRTRARQRMAKRKDRFVVGYLSTRNIVFGRDTRRGDWTGYTDAARPLTLRQANRKLLEMPSAGCAIFELTPLKVNR